MQRFSNTVIGFLNFFTLLASIPIIGAGLWMARSTTTCENFLQTPLLVIGFVVLVISLAGFVGACFHVAWALCLYLVVMLFLMVALFGLTVFGFVVTSQGRGVEVPGRVYMEYRLEDYSPWLKNRIKDPLYWSTIRSCVLGSNTCAKLASWTSLDYMQRDMSPIQAIEDNARRWFDHINLCNQQKEELAFLRGFVAAFKEQIHTDILVNPGNNGPPIPAHKSVLAARSEIFKNMLECDQCKASPNNNTITIPDLNHDELESLLEFLYSGTMASEKLEKHVYALSQAADKYDIPHLLKKCEIYLLSSLSTSNALETLEIADTCSNNKLKETTLDFLVKNIEHVVSSAKFEAFVHRSPQLTVELVTRAFVNGAKSSISPQV